MVERIKNKKGFTIIEIMVVIALIGILAAVLVPRFDGIKNRAKDAGVLTNAKMVEAYVASEIDSWTKVTAIDETKYDMIEAIEKYFATNKLKNPYTGDDNDNLVVVPDTDTGYREGTSTAADAGIVYVVINTAASSLEVYINGFDVSGNEIKASQRTVTQ